MPTNEKRGRGRPKKNVSIVENEEVEKINMSNQDIIKSEKREEKSNSFQMNEIKFNEIKNGVGIVKESQDSFNSSGRITVEAVHDRWRQIFVKYNTFKIIYI